MEKKKINIKKPKNIVLDINDEESIVIRPYLTVAEQTFLIKDYIDSLYDENSDALHNYTMAEYSLVLGIIDICTDIDIEDMDVDDIINSDIWNIIQDKIFYKDLRIKINEIIKRIDTEKSFGSVVKDITDKINSILNKFLEIDVSKFDMQEINKMFDKLKEEKSNLDNTIFNKENESVSVPPSIIAEKKPRKKKSSELN
jgi:hypothetical protein